MYFQVMRKKLRSNAFNLIQNGKKNGDFNGKHEWTPSLQVVAVHIYLRKWAQTQYNTQICS